MNPPTPENVNEALRAIETAELPENHPRKLAVKAVANRRARQSPQLTQAKIDTGSETEERRQRFVASSVRWSKRSLLARIFRR